ncbi:MAG: thioredoxin family protein [Bacteroidales bacterium]|nr:thioredoxin family protein [Bacteroidales bacterium]
MKALKVLIFFLTFSICSFAQTAEWEIHYEPTGTTKDTFLLIIDVNIPDEFHMYSFDQEAGGPIAATISFTLPDGIKKIGGLQILSEQPETFFDDIFEVQIRQFTKKTKWAQRFVITKTIAPNTKITGEYSYQLCKDDGYCLNPLPEKFVATVPAHAIKDVKVTKAETIPEKEDSITHSADTEPIADTITVLDTIPRPIEQVANDREQETRPLWLIFLLGFLGGILAFLTPCVFPMVPMTVSMFLRRNKQHALRDVLIYGASIVAIFVFLGLCITMIFGVDALNKLSTEPLFNLLFFIIFIIFAISFFGVFELMLPSSWINAIDQKADSSNGFVSIFFMAFTLVLVSFSCTAMIIGTLLVESVVSGSIIGPMIGMLGFAIALSLPFIVFAAVPSLLSSLSKSGDWMNDIKISLGFIELAFALKFISKADLVAGWGILPRDLFIAIWIIILIVWGLCILRIIRLGHAQKKKLSKTRIAIAIIIFLFAAYLIPGFLGKPIDLISGYLPPMTTQKIHILSEETNTEEIQSKKKYGTIFHTPYGIEAFYDYDEGLAYAKSINKPILLDFTGLGCENCRKIEMNVWAKPEILSIIKEKYVLISLYLDSREPLDSSLVRIEQYGDKSYEIKTVGEHWSIFMMKNYQGLMQPYYVLLSPDGEKLTEPITYTEAKSAENYKNFLLQGLEEFQK